MRIGSSMRVATAVKSRGDERRMITPHMTFGLFFFSSRRRHTRFDCDWSSDVCFSDRMIRHTRFDCDWSSDVCSSDLDMILLHEHLFHASFGGGTRRQWRVDYVNAPVGAEAGNHTDRKSVV